MAADKQYADALNLLKLIEDSFLATGCRTTYGEACNALGYQAATHARHFGQVCSLIDAACYWAKLPSLSLEKIRMDNGEHNPNSFVGQWESVKQVLIDHAAAHNWTKDDIARIRRMLTSVNGEGAVLQWKKIDSFGAAGRERATSYI
jgi:hypothetical protein